MRNYDEFVKWFNESLEEEKNRFLREAFGISNVMAFTATRHEKNFVFHVYVCGFYYKFVFGNEDILGNKKKWIQKRGGERCDIFEFYGDWDLLNERDECLRAIRELTDGKEDRL